jgi:hypothetical protein
MISFKAKILLGVAFLLLWNVGVGAQYQEHVIMDFEDGYLPDRAWFLSQPIGTSGFYVEPKIDSGADTLSLAVGEGRNGSDAMLVEANATTQGLPGFHLLNGTAQYGYVGSVTNDAEGYMLPRGMRANRFEFYVRFQHGYRTNQAAGSILSLTNRVNMHLGTYHYDPGLPGDRRECYNWHFYHHIMLRHDLADTNWLHVVLNECPQHQRSLSPLPVANATKPFGNYWEILTRCYFDGHPYFSDPEIPRPVRMWIDDITLSYVPEPDNIGMQIENYIDGQEITLTNSGTYQFALRIQNRGPYTVTGNLVQTTAYWYDPELLDESGTGMQDTNLVLQYNESTNMIIQISPRTNLVYGRLDYAGLLFVPKDQYNRSSATNGCPTFADPYVEKRNFIDPGTHDAVVYDTHMRIRIGTMTGNDRPTALGGVTCHVLQDTVFTNRIKASDPDRDPITYSIVTQDGTNVMLNATNGVYTFHPDAGFTGLYTFQYLVNDGQSNSDVAVTWFDVLPNTDHDVLPDAWETNYFASTTNAPSDDPDRDTFSTLDEYVSGTDPSDSNSYPQVNLTCSNKQVTITYPGQNAYGPGYRGRCRHMAYIQNHGPATDTWTAITGFSNMISQGTSIQLDADMTLPKAFYSYKVWLDEAH